MKEETTLENKKGCYALTRYEDIAILRLGKDFLLESIDLSVSNRLLDVFERISQSHEIKVLAMQCLFSLQPLGVSQNETIGFF